jgi:hypothetical protein
MVDKIHFTEKSYNDYLNSLLRFESVLRDKKKYIYKKRRQFLKYNFYKHDDQNLKEAEYSYITQFVPWIPFLVLCGNDEEIKAKLKEFKVKESTLNLMIDIDKIVFEIRRLQKIDGLLIFPEELLINSINYGEIVFLKTLLDEVLPDHNYNNGNKTSIEIYLINFFRRYLYRLEVNKAVGEKIISFDDLMVAELDEKVKNILEAGESPDEVTKQFRKIVLGDLKIILNSFNTFFIVGISKNEYYSQLFGFLKQVVKNSKMLDEDTFYKFDIDGYYKGDYRFYKISRVKNLLKL